ncbi:BnaA01g23540D [Brassica napus]|uniref:BnaA01g23540D protein n=1 Tax=Brassica napus TaxID=3708 RepID=A0A078G0G3_BRANA|nr:BnaA01g23540D [Brassica napus]
MEAPTPHLLLLLLFAVSLLTATTADDGAAMLALAKSLSPPPSDWSTTSSTGYCKWSGVRCSSDRVSSINLEDKSLSGGLAPEISTLSELKTITLQRNKLTGKIPSFAKLASLQEIYIDSNLFDGVEPGAFAGLTSLQILSMSDNPNLSPWSFPSELAESTSLTTIYLDNTTISGALPDIFENFASLQNLRLSYNNITGPLPPSLAKSSIQNLWINNQLSGLSGSIEVLSGMTSLSQAWLQKNHLYLNDNNLTGDIPKVLTSMPSLNLIDVSNNNLTGEILKFPDPVKFTYKPGNVLLGTDAGDSSSPGAGGKGGGGSGGSSGGGGGGGGGSKAPVIIGVIVAVLVFLAILGFVVYKFVMKKKYGKFRRTTDPENAGKVLVSDAASNGNGNGHGGGANNFNALNSPSSGDNSERFLLEGGSVTIPMEVLRQVTNNFSEANILGRGGFGVVYAGELHDGTKTAVKRMECSAMGNKGMNEFQAEIAVLTKVRHRHLVALLGYCVNGNERLLVYEYMPQGNLGQHLFEYGELGYSPLTWKQRVSIALDVARGVEYLHSLAQQSFIHRDLKPSNILLGDDMRAKVADFGLVKNAPDGKYSVETRLAGTFGYLAPEYAATGRVTTKVDVYAFGVVLMEMITGRKALDDSLPDERSHLVTWFRRILINKENIPKAIDQTLEADEETLESIHRVAELAGHCTAREPQQRPDMGHAVNVLGPLVEKWKPSCQEEEESFGIDVNNMSLPQALQRWQQNEGTSTSMFHGDFSYSQTQSSIPPKPSGFPNTFDSADGR